MKLWIDGEREAPDKSWTRVTTAPEAIKLLEAGGVEEINFGDFPDEEESGIAGQVFEWLIQRVSGTSYALPTLSVHATTEDSVGSLSFAFRRITALPKDLSELRSLANVDIQNMEEWKRFLKDGEDEMFRRARAEGDPFGHMPDANPVLHYLIARLKQALPQLEELLRNCDREPIGEDLFYRFYHQSWKVYGLQGPTLAIVKALQAVLPYEALNKWFLQIVREGTEKEFDRNRMHEINANWLAETRPIVEAFLHARTFLALCVKYATELPFPPRLLPSGWASVLHLFNLR